jgi:hypothetical protein
MLTQRLTLGPGRNVVSALGYTRDGKLGSKAVEAVVTVRPSGEKATLHVLAVGVTGTVTRAGGRCSLRGGGREGDRRRLRHAGLGAVAQVSPPVVLVDGQATRARIERH